MPMIQDLDDVLDLSHFHNPIRFYIVIYDLQMLVSIVRDPRNSVRVNTKLNH